MKTSRWLLGEALALTLVAVTAGGGGGAAMAAPSDKGIDPDADRILRQMTDYLASLKSFTVRTAVTDEVAMKSGEKIQTASNAQISVERPNKLHSEQRGHLMGLGLWYDGKTMTVACQATHSYQTIPAPPTLDQAIDKMRQAFEIDAPGADLLYSRPYDVLTEQVVGGRLVGLETIDGVPANHLALQGEQVDLQLWIQAGPQPLPLRYVIVTKTVRGGPEFAVELSDWNTKPQLMGSTFQFQPAPDAKSAQAVVSSCGGSP
jgi:hypothetical protein